MQLKGFQVFKFRNIIDSGWVEVRAISAFVGQNECGKSNLLTALYLFNPYEKTKYDIKSDWPIDQWPPGSTDTVVCKTRFTLSAEDIAALFKHAEPVAEEAADPKAEQAAPAKAKETRRDLPPTVDVTVERNYASAYRVELPDTIAAQLDEDKAKKWITSHLPKCVYMDDYLIFQGRAELDSLLQKVQQHGREKLSDEENTILITLELAGLDINDLAAKVGSTSGRTERGFDTNAASGYLTRGTNGVRLD